MPAALYFKRLGSFETIGLVTAGMYQLNSSFRLVDPEITLANARSFAPRLGISRVTDITRLDIVGIPVFASVRPAAIEGSLCVNAGKGVTRIEAQVGAYMEAIEFALAEPGTSHVKVFMATGRDVLDGNRRSAAILDLCPIVRRGIDLSAPLACVEARDLLSGRNTLVPAELVLLPYVRRPGTGNFGSHSNGLASGNTVSEAALHALLEVVERDIRSFQFVHDQSQRIRLESLSGAPLELAQKIREAEIDLAIRTHSNPFHLAFFQAVLCHRHPHPGGAYDLSAGYGCHLRRDIALVRAITEAVQSRLSWIHGGRDNLADQSRDFEKLSVTDPGQAAATQFAALCRTGEMIDYGDIPDWKPESFSVDDALDSTMGRLYREGIQQVCLVVLTEPHDPLAVVRIIVPRLEFLNRDSHRLGPRLHEFIRKRSA